MHQRVVLAGALIRESAPLAVALSHSTACRSIAIALQLLGEVAPQARAFGDNSASRWVQCAPRGMAASAPLLHMWCMRAAMQLGRNSFVRPGVFPGV